MQNNQQLSFIKPNNHIWKPSCILLLLFFSLSLTAMEEIELLSKKRKQAKGTTSQVKKRKLSRNEGEKSAIDFEAEQSDTLSRDDCFKLWLEKKIKADKRKTHLSNEALCYFYTYGVRDTQQEIANLLIETDIEPYYIGRILEIVPLNKTLKYHDFPPHALLKPDKSINIECVRKDGCLRGITIPSPNTLQRRGKKFSKDTYHQWHFAQNFTEKHRLPSLRFIIETEEKNLIIGYSNDKRIFQLLTGSLLTKKRDALKGKLTLEETLLLKYSQQKTQKRNLKPYEKQIDALKHRINEICKDKKPDEQNQ